MATSHRHDDQPEHPPHEHHQHGHPTHSDLAAALDLDAELVGDHLDDAATLIVEALGGPPARIVDLGAGTGSGTEALARRFPDATLLAVDSSPAMTETIDRRARAAGLTDRVTTVVADLDRGLPQMRRPDVIWAAMSLHHIADAGALLRSAATALGSEGVLVIVEMAGLPRFAADDDAGLRALEDRCHAAAARAGWEALADWTTTIGDAGLEIARDRTIRVERADPAAQVSRYAVHWFSQFRHRLDEPAGMLSRADVELLDTLIDPAQASSLHRRTDLRLVAGRRVWIVRPIRADGGVE